MNKEFIAWPKIPRGGSEKVTITEKIDGTNACIVIDGDFIGAQSRNKVITPEDDNYGFAGWVQRNKDQLLLLGDGYHYGEWAGLGIQGNPMQLSEKVLFLFNTARWNKDNPNLPICCSVVPVLAEEILNHQTIPVAMGTLKSNREYQPEGIIVWYHKSRRYEKYTFNTPEGKRNSES